LSGGGEISKDLKKQLKKAELLLGFKLESTLDFNGTAYSLTFLLPDSVSKDRIIGLVSISDDNSAEFYNYTIDGSLITITVDSPESFYLAVTKSPLPLILTIALILLFLVAVILLAYRYLKQRELYTVHIRDESDVTALQVSNGSRAVNPFEKKTDTALDTFSGECEEPIGNADQAEEETSDDPDANKGQVEPKDTEGSSTDEESRIPLGTQFKKRFFDFQSRGSRRAEINLDILAAHFESGDTINLDSMIAKGLLPPDTTFVKVLARGKISKPLTIAAQDFSTAAMRMILLAGGNATITEEKID
jgi:large subunit ribosomal protein L15